MLGAEPSASSLQDDDIKQEDNITADSADSGTKRHLQEHDEHILDGKRRKVEETTDVGAKAEDKQDQEAEPDDIEAEIENLMLEAKKSQLRGKKRGHYDDDENGSIKADDQNDQQNIEDVKKGKDGAGSLKRAKVNRKETDTSDSDAGSAQEERDAKKDKREGQPRRAEGRITRREAERLRLEEELMHKRMLLATLEAELANEQKTFQQIDSFLDDELDGHSGYEDEAILAEEMGEEPGRLHRQESSFVSTRTPQKRGRPKGKRMKSKSTPSPDEEMEMVYGREALLELSSHQLLIQSKMRGLPMQVRTPGLHDEFAHSQLVMQKRRKEDIVRRIVMYDDEMEAQRVSDDTEQPQHQGDDSDAKLSRTEAGVPSEDTPFVHDTEKPPAPKDSQA